MLPMSSSSGLLLKNYVFFLMRLLLCFVIIRNYNYGPAGVAVGFDGIHNPEIVASDATVSFKTAMWFWMTAQSPKPSCHDVITAKWTPSASDSTAGGAAGYGLLTNIIYGGVECGNGSNAEQEDRIGFYEKYSDILSVGYGSNLDCNTQKAYPP